MDISDYIEQITVIFGILYLRYILIAGIFFVIYYHWRRSKISWRKIQHNFPKLADYQREILFSTLTTLIFAVIGYAIFAPNLLRPYTQIYVDFSDHSVSYFLFSIVLIILLHDTYFYWTHRLMHTPIGMRYVHLVHHKSTNPSPWAAFAFHPFEAVVEAGILPLVAFLFPIHYWAIIIFMIFMTLYNVYGHLGWELYPRRFNNSSVGKWINTSVSHNQHHQFFNGNYGLYFLFWDRMMGTLRPDYAQAFESKR